jgi:hypothetical protein
MRSTPLSIAMCTYNGALHLREQLESIAAQTRLPDELVICDDRSTRRVLTAGLSSPGATGTADVLLEGALAGVELTLNRLPHVF